MSALLDARGLVKHLGRPPRGRRGGPRLRDLADRGPARAQRRGQDHDAPDAVRLPAPGRGPDPRQRGGAGPRPGRGPSARSACARRTTPSTATSRWSRTSTIAARYFRPRPTDLGRRVAELLERFDLAALRAAEAGDALRRLPAAADDRARARAPPAPALPRRAHHRPRPAGAHGGVGSRRRPARRGPRHHPDHALHGRGGAAERRAHRAGPRPRGGARHRQDVLGDLVGEHVVVVDAGAGARRSRPGSRRAGAASRRACWAPCTCRCSGEELAEFARAFPALRYEVRGPTLDDLFLKLALARAVSWLAAALEWQSRAVVGAPPARLHAQLAHRVPAARGASR